LLGRLKTSPDGFNGPAGFLLVGDLGAGTLNMSTCMVQASIGGTVGISVDLHDSQKYLDLANTCGDAATLFYTVYETAFNMYADFLLAQDGQTKHAMSTLERCVDGLKEKQKR